VDIAMNTKLLIDSALKLSPAERFTLIDELMKSLDRPDPSIDRLWVKEAELRLAEHRAGRVSGISASDVVGEF
jgi:putative addiction module component (TIGR02574 family)